MTILFEIRLKLLSLYNLQKDQKIKDIFSWKTLKVFLAVGLFGLILSQANLSDIVGLKNRISWVWLFASMFSFYASVCSMSYRYWILINKKITIWQTLNLVTLQTIIGNLVATGAGLISYISLLRSRHEVKVVHSLRSLFYAKLLDFFFMFIGLALSSLFLWSQISAIRNLVIFLLLFFTTSIIITFFSIRFAQRYAKQNARSLLNSSWLGKVSLFRHISKSLEKFEQDNSAQLSLPGLQLVAFSALTFIFIFSFSYTTVRLFAVPVSLWQVLFVLSLTQLISLIPIQIFGGLGVQDYSTIFLYGLFGIQASSIIPAIIGIRAVFYLINCSLFFYFFVEAVWKRKNLGRVSSLTEAERGEGK